MRSEIFEAFAQLAKSKNIDKDILESVIKDSFAKMMEKRYGPTANFDIIVNMEKGNIEIFLYKVVVETVQDPNTEIDVETAKELSGEDLEVGDDYVEELPIEKFGRRQVLNLKQNLNQKIREIDKEVTFNKYKDLVGEILVAEVYQIKQNLILLIDNGNEITFPKGEQIPKERYKKGEQIRALIKSVTKKPSGPPIIVVSRTDDDFLKKLFEIEIPEIYDGVIEIKAIAREPGERAKVAVISNDDRIDAVGACVGMKGMRIHSIVRELSNENIDVVNYSDDIEIFIRRALSPAEIDDIIIDNANRTAKIKAQEDQISMIIGKNGQNIKLASKLTGYQIDVLREDKEATDAKNEKIFDGTYMSENEEQTDETEDITEEEIESEYDEEDIQENDVETEIESETEIENEPEIEENATIENDSEKEPDEELSKVEPEENNEPSEEVKSKKRKSKKKDTEE